MEGAGEDLFVRYMQNALIYLLCGPAVQRAQNIFGAVGVGGDKAVIAHRVIDVLLVGFYAAVQISNYGIGYGVLIDAAVCRNLSLIARSAHERNAPFAQNGV